jgi:hypothetical protein
LDERAFWFIGAGESRKSGIEAAVAKAVSNDREERDASLTSDSHSSASHLR